MPSSIMLTVIGVATIFLVSLLVKLHLPGLSLRLPPGPKGLPLLGNVLQMPKSHAYLLWQEWSKKYGPIIHLNMLGMNVVALHSVKSAQDLLARRGGKYSDRPRLILAGELAMKGKQLVLMPYNAEFKLHQKIMTPLLNPHAVTSYQPLADIESRQLLFNIFAETSNNQSHGVDHHHHLERCVASITYALIFGTRLLTGHEPEIAKGRIFQEDFAKLMVGLNLVDIFPWLNRIPLPWPWKETAERFYLDQKAFHLDNMHKALERPGWNFSKEMSRSAEAKQMSEEHMAFDLGSIADNALDTTVVSMDWFVIAWITQGSSPRRSASSESSDAAAAAAAATGTAALGFVARAREELDEVVGRDRLPRFEDHPRLPFLDAIVEEVLRWRPIAVTGVPHVTNTADEYEGFQIPAGSLVTANQWAITRDPEVFGEDADEFRPERWLVGDGEKLSTPTTTTATKSKSDGASLLRDLPTIGFGFGRRICPGRHVARREIWIQIVRLLWAFDIEGAVSQETGAKVDVDPSPLKAIDSLIIRPLPFNVVFKPRGPWVEKVIRETCDTLGEDFVSLLDQIGLDRAARQLGRTVLDE